MLPDRKRVRSSTSATSRCMRSALCSMVFRSCASSIRIGLDRRVAEQPDTGPHGGQGRTKLVGDRLPMLGNLADDGRRAGHGTVCVAQEGNREFQGDSHPIPPDGWHGQELPAYLVVPVAMRAVPAPVLLPQPLRDDEVERRPECLVGPVAEHRFGPGIPEADLAFPVADDNCILGLLQDLSTASFEHLSRERCPGAAGRSHPVARICCVVGLVHHQELRTVAEWVALVTTKRWFVYRLPSASADQQQRSRGKGMLLSLEIPGRWPRRTSHPRPPRSRGVIVRGRVGGSRSGSSSSYPKCRGRSEHLGGLDVRGIHPVSGRQPGSDTLSAWTLGARRCEHVQDTESRTPPARAGALSAPPCEVMMTPRCSTRGFAHFRKFTRQDVRVIPHIDRRVDAFHTGAFMVCSRAYGRSLTIRVPDLRVAPVPRTSASRAPDQAGRAATIRQREVGHDQAEARV